MPTLYNQNIPGSSCEKDPHGRPLLHVETPHALIRAIGYLKHTVQPWERVLFRGQNCMHLSLCPSLYRGLTSTATQAARHAKVNQIVRSFSDPGGIFEICRSTLMNLYSNNTASRRLGWMSLIMYGSPSGLPCMARTLLASIRNSSTSKKERPLVLRNTDTYC